MQRYQTLKDNAREQHLIRIRIILAVVCIVILISILVGRYYFLQIDQYEYYQTQSQQNRVQLEKIPPTRGLIFDREQRLIADNQPSFVLALVPNRITDMKQTLQTLKNLSIVDDDDIHAFEKKVKRYRSFEAVPIQFNINEETIARVAANRIRLEGVEIKVNMVRYYPEKELVTHMLGYVGRINEKEMTTLDKDNYGATNHIGKIGIEKSYEDILHGTVGYEHVEANAHGEVLRILERTDPIAGKNLTLHLDLDLQKIAYDAIGEGSRGAVVAINARTGGVLVATSRPSYDPNLFVNGISFSAYKGLREDIDLPLFNRVLQAQYPPGSTIKPIMAVAGLEENVVTASTTISDPGVYHLPGETHAYRDWKKGGHGSVDLNVAIEQSCDVYFYQLANKLGVKRIHSYFDKFGLGNLTQLDVPDERKGINPSPEWKKANGRGGWYAGDTVNIGIGQGVMLATPLQLAYATSIIANRGKRLIPQMVAKEDNTIMPIKQLPPLKLKNEENWQSVINGMRSVVMSPRGTAKGINPGLTYEIAGKTGTAQVVGIKQGEKYNASLVAKRNRDHALFVAFAPIENPEIVIAIIVENGEHGSSTAAPIARKVMDAWMEKLQKNKKAIAE